MLERFLGGFKNLRTIEVEDLTAALIAGLAVVGWVGYGAYT